MKRIIITGKDGYIATHIKSWLEKDYTNYSVSLLDARTDGWKKSSFKGVDVIVHTAGIVHQPQITDWNIYYSTNVLLTENLAAKAKADGVKQFIFFSTMAVYGIGKSLKPTIIDENTPCNPKDLYGKSKYQAEQKLKAIEDSSFRVSIIRPPNVYGYNCKGNYIKGFTKAVQAMPIIPYAFPEVKQSMLYIDNLTELVKMIIDESAVGIFTPQDETAISAVELMVGISNGIYKKARLSKSLGYIVLLLRFTPIVKKVYGGVQYDDKLTTCFNKKYIISDFDESIKRTIHGKVENNSRGVFDVQGDKS